MTASGSICSSRSSYLLGYRGLAGGLQESGAVVVEPDFAGGVLGLFRERSNLDSALGVGPVDIQIARGRIDTAFGAPALGFRRRLSRNPLSDLDPLCDLLVSLQLGKIGAVKRIGLFARAISL
jgi:hypothetical protein